MREVLVAVTEYLDSVVSEQMAPAEACARLLPLQDLHPEARIDLVWEDQAFDGSWHYDALIRPATGGPTVSVSVCPDDALPWPLRGLQRWRDSDLLRVNGTVMSVASAISKVDVLWEKTSLMQRLIDSCLIEGELRRRALTVSATEVQTAFDAMRRRRGLLSAADMEAWMLDTGTNLATLQKMAIDLARASKLRDLLVGEDVDRAFSEKRAAFDTIGVAVFETPSERVAFETAAVVRAGRGVFLEIAQRAFLEDRTGRTEISFQKNHRYKFIGPTGQCLEGAGKGDVVGPIAGEDRFRVIHVLSVETVKMGDGARSTVKAKLFEDWLQKERRAANIEWFWGDAKQTQRPA